jgi:hypothetical protein
MKWLLHAAGIASLQGGKKDAFLREPEREPIFAVINTEQICLGSPTNGCDFN